MQCDERDAGRLAQRKRAISGTLRRVGVVFPLVIGSHTILLPQGTKVCGKFLSAGSILVGEPRQPEMHLQEVLALIDREGIHFSVLNPPPVELAVWIFLCSSAVK